MSGEEGGGGVSYAHANITTTRQHSNTANAQQHDNTVGTREPYPHTASLAACTVLRPRPASPRQPPPDSSTAAWQHGSTRGCPHTTSYGTTRQHGSTTARQHGSTAAHAALRRRTCSRQPPGVAWIKLRRRRINIGLHTLTLPITIHSIAGCRSPRAGQKASRRYLRRRIKQVLFRCCSRHRDEHGTHGNKPFSTQHYE
jgi:hypothetical protein